MLDTIIKPCLIVWQETVKRGLTVYGIQAEIARRTKKTPAFVSMVWRGKYRIALYPTAVLFADATGTKPELWLKGSAAEIRAAVQESMGEI